MLDILSVSNTYTNSATLSVSQLEQGGALGATDVLVCSYHYSLVELNASLLN